MTVPHLQSRSSIQLASDLDASCQLHPQLEAVETHQGHPVASWLVLQCNCPASATLLLQSVGQTPYPQATLRRSHQRESHRQKHHQRSPRRSKTVT
jgi:hypothetical protein